EVEVLLPVVVPDLCPIAADDDDRHTTAGGHKHTALDLTPIRHRVPSGIQSWRAPIVASGSSWLLFIFARGEQRTSKGRRQVSGATLPLPGAAPDRPLPITAATIKSSRLPPCDSCHL